MDDYKQLKIYKEQYPDVKPIDISGDLPRHSTKKHKLRKLSDIKRIVVHTTDWDTTPKRIAEYDVGKNHISDTGCPAVTYHEFIMKDGMLYHTLPFEEVSWHAGMWNKGSLAVALMFRVSGADGKDTHAPTDLALKALQTRCGDLCLRFRLTPDNVVGHRELKGTGWLWFKGSKRLRKTCPGKKVDLDLLRLNVATYMQVVLKLKGLYKGEIDGIFGPLSKAALNVS
jgi:hypothetical protein